MIAIAKSDQLKKKSVCLGESFPWAPHTTILEVSFQFCPRFITHHDVMLIGTYTLMVAIFSCQVVQILYAIPLHSYTL